MEPEPLQRREMKFASEHMDRLASGEKTMTIRLTDEWNGLCGLDEFHITDEDGHRVGKADVKRARTLNANEAFHVANDVSGHRDYHDIIEFIDELRGYYPEAEIGIETEFRVIRFEVTEFGGNNER